MTNPEQLINAVKNSDWQEACRCIDTKKIDINSKDKDGLTALMHAIIMDKGIYILRLLRHDARVDLTDNMGRTALMHAAEHCTGTLTNHLLKLNNRNINDTDINGNTALFYAAKAFHHGAAEVLMDAGADATILNKMGESAIHTAIRTNLHNHHIKMFIFYRQLAITTPGKEARDFIKMYAPAIDQEDFIEFMYKQLHSYKENYLEKMLHIKMLLSPATSLGQYIHFELTPSLRFQQINKLSEALKELTQEPICKAWLAQHEPARLLLFSGISPNLTCGQKKSLSTNMPQAKM